MLIFILSEQVCIRPFSDSDSLKIARRRMKERQTYTFKRFLTLFRPQRRRALIDALARHTIRVGGLIIILAVMAVFAVLLAESWPLFRGPRIKSLDTIAFSEKHEGTFLVGGFTTDPYAHHVLFIFSNGSYRVYNLDQHRIVFSGELPWNDDESPIIRLIRKDPWHESFLFVDHHGHIYSLVPQWQWTFDASNQRVLQGFSMDLIRWQTQLPEEASAFTLDWSADDEDPHLGEALIIGTNQIWWIRRSVSSSLFGEGQAEEQVQNLTVQKTARLTSAAIGDTYLAAGTSDGRLFIYPKTFLTDNPHISPQVYKIGEASTPVTALGVLIGRSSLVIGDSNGHLLLGFPVPNPQRPFDFRIIRRFRSMSGTIVAIVPDYHTRAFLTLSDQGELGWLHSTAEKTRFMRKIFSDAIPLSASIAPDRSMFVVQLDNQQWRTFLFKDPHPEVSFASLFKKIWYEGYDGPRFIWQSSSGHDSFEPKYSLVPLIVGTLKGTFYALLFAIPLAILGALFMGQFLDPGVRARLKPIIELMAGLPSVVLGFIGGLWLAPRVEQWFPALLFSPFIIFMAIIGVHPVWTVIPRKPLNPRARDIFRLIFLAMWILCWCALVFFANHALEEIFFGGDYQAWFLKHLGWTYEQRNALVVGFVMGYAVIPIIFSIAEESIVAVPRDWIAGAYALGATRWQTLVHIVIPASLSGIVSAVMIGFGRAIGETMIVLMATGNTPVLNWSPFTGFRTLSANLAVELPEAPVGETHYRVLFFSALLLFFFTITINTVAELLREKIRKQYYRK